MTNVTTVEEFKAIQEAELQAFIAQKAKEEAKAQNTKKKELLNVYGIKFEEVARTYVGDTGCACGCGGDYVEANDNVKLTNTRINKINKAILEGRVEFFGSGVQVANEAYTRVTRLYFVDGVEKYKAGK